MKITAALTGAPDADFVLTQVDLDKPRPDEVLVRMEAVGLCHSDLSVVRQATPFPLPAVLGHEGVGVVQQVGRGVTEFAKGDRVVLSFTSCGACRGCASGHPVLCSSWLPMNLLGGSRLDGSTAYTRGSEPIHGHFFGQSSFATHTVVQARAAIGVPRSLPAELLAPLGCGVQTGTGAVFNVARPGAGDDIVIYGAGGVGLSAVMAAALSPAARIIAVDINPARLDLARELGATHTVNSAEVDPRAAVAELTGGGADIALETSGRVEVLAQALGGLRSGGTCVVIGAPPLGTQLPVDVPELLGRGLRLVGTNQGDSVPRIGIPRLVDLIEQGRLPVERLVTTYPFADINQAAADARAGIAIKPVMTFA